MRVGVSYRPATMVMPFASKSCSAGDCVSAVPMYDRVGIDHVMF
jgi:hypothetical protein